ncbi:MAG: carboxypeptidase regulatory-like domain-containing protein [Bryobacteraceae bacterium]
MRFISVLLLATSAVVQAQTFNATLTGRALDPSGAVVPSVALAITNTATGVAQKATTNSEGVYNFALIHPGRYTLSATATGFASVEITGIALEVGARTAVDIELKVSASGASIQVTADAGALQLKTESGERSDVITNRQIRDLALNGRNILDLMKVLPGVVSNVNGQVSNDGGLRNFNINGARGTQKEVSIDGSSNVISGANQRVHVTVNPDAIQEVKVLTSNYQAEYGKTAGGYIQYTTRSGGRDFHGGARYFRRHDSLNANNFFSNAQGRPRQLYRYNYYGYDIGGPVYIPGRFNRNRDKLFFFWNQEYYRQTVPGGVRSIRVPTDAERRGDFSQTTDGNGNPVFIRDPLSTQPCTAANRAGCFTNNVIPASRLFADGPKLLSIYPTPNDPTGGAQYNYSSQFSNQTPRREDIVRMDWNISSKTRLASRYIQNSERTVQRYGGCNNIAYNFPLTDLETTQGPRNASFNLVHTFTPTLINELTVAPSRSYTTCNSDSDKLRPRGIRRGLSFAVRQ